MHMKVIIVLASLLLPWICAAQKLVLDENEVATGKRIKETEWVKMRCKNGSVLRLKVRKVDDDVRIYHRSRLRGKSEDAACHDVDIALFFEDQTSLNLPSEITNNSWRVGSKSNAGEQEHNALQEPEGTPTKMLSAEQISSIAKNKLRTFQICFFNRPIRLELREKDQHLLSNCIKAVM
jgi:hypothetical protein